jgi:hypothetical protein
VEQPILDHQRHLEVPARKIEMVLDGIANEVKALEPRVEVQARGADSVIVIPELGGRLVATTPPTPIT